MTHIFKGRKALGCSHLEGRLPSQQEISDTGEVRVFNSGDSSALIPLSSSPVYCPYYKTICPENIHKYSMKCVFNQKECTIRKFYEKYGEMYNFLGIGSKL